MVLTQFHLFFPAAFAAQHGHDPSLSDVEAPVCHDLPLPGSRGNSVVQSDRRSPSGIMGSEPRRKPCCLIDSKETNQPEVPRASEAAGVLSASRLE